MQHNKDNIKKTSVIPKKSLALTRSKQKLYMTNKTKKNKTPRHRKAKNANYSDSKNIVKCFNL